MNDFDKFIETCLNKPLPKLDNADSNSSKLISAIVGRSRIDTLEILEDFYKTFILPNEHKKP